MTPSRAIYFDWNATAPLAQAAKAAMLATLAETGNPSSVHAFGRRARARLETARQAVADLVGAKAENVIFTSGGSEANALAFAAAGTRPAIVSAIEHDSVLKPAQIGTRPAAILPVGKNGIVDLDHLAVLLDRLAEPAFLSLMLANNETGILQPVAEAAKLAKAKGALVHCDAVQAAGRVALDIAELGIDYLTLSAHKLGGPPGVGALIAASGAPIAPLILGGGQERNRRAGTENLPGIAGFGAAAAAARDLASVETVRRLRDALEDRLLALGLPMTIFGRQAPRLANTSCFAAGTKTSETLVMAFDLAGIAISAGSACSSGKVRPSPVIQAMGFDIALAASAIRVSLGPANTIEEIAAFVATFAEIHRLRPGLADMSAA